MTVSSASDSRSAARAAFLPGLRAGLIRSPATWRSVRVRPGPGPGAGGRVAGRASAPVGSGGQALAQFLTRVPVRGVLQKCFQPRVGSGEGTGRPCTVAAAGLTLGRGDPAPLPRVGASLVRPARSPPGGFSGSWHQRERETEDVNFRWRLRV